MAEGDGKKPGPPPEQQRDRIDAGRRRLFRMFATPFSAAMKGYELPANHTSKNPPVERLVIRPGPGNALVLGLIGPLAQGQAAGAGFFLDSATAGEDEIRYLFARGAERVQLVFARPGSRQGAEAGSTRTFVVYVESTVAPAEADVVARAVLLQARARDQGQLWTTAARSVASKRPG